MRTNPLALDFSCGLLDRLSGSPGLPRFSIWCSSRPFAKLVPGKNSLSSFSSGAAGTRGPIVPGAISLFRRSRSSSFADRLIRSAFVASRALLNFAAGILLVFARPFSLPLSQRPGRLRGGGPAKAAGAAIAPSRDGLRKAFRFAGIACLMWPARCLGFFPLRRPKLPFNHRASAAYLVDRGSFSRGSRPAGTIGVIRAVQYRWAPLSAAWAQQPNCPGRYLS